MRQLADETKSSRNLRAKSGGREPARGRSRARSPIALVLAGAGLGAAVGAFASTNPLVAALAGKAIWIGAGAGVGGAIGALAAWWTDPVRARIRRRDEIAADATHQLNLPFAGTADLRALAPDRRTPIGLLLDRPSSPFATGVRDVLFALDRALDAYFGGRIVLVAGPHAGVGATTLAASLAIAAAAEGRRVLLIDADLRGRGVTLLLGAKAQAGIHEVAVGAAPLSAAIARADAYGFDVATAGPSRSGGQELYSSVMWSQTLAQARLAYDLVIIDAPPALESVEARMLARTVDATLIAGRRAKTRRLAAQAASAILSRPDGSAPIAAAVMTDAPPPKSKPRRRR